MNNKKLFLIAFILVALAQLFVPAKMIWNREVILSTGKEYRFKTAPIDPTDPFRGKYITLQYSENRIQVPQGSEWSSNETVYVLLKKDANGFASIESVSKEKPKTNLDFVKAKVGYLTNEVHNLIIQYPFDRFYMEESKAPIAESVYAEATLDTTKVAYALVRIKNGEAVLKDVLIDGITIQQLAKIRKKKN